MGSSINKLTQKCQAQTKFASKPQKSTWPQTSSLTLASRSSLSPNSSTSASLEAASAHEHEKAFLNEHLKNGLSTGLDTPLRKNTLKKCKIYILFQLHMNDSNHFISLPE